jgi:hypothetical protein
VVVVVVVVVGGTVVVVVVGTVVVVVVGTVVVVVVVVVGGLVVLVVPVPKVKGSLTKEGRLAATPLVFGAFTVGSSGVMVGILIFGGVVGCVGTGVAEPGTTWSPLAGIVVVTDAAESALDDLPTKRMALRPATITAPATMIDHRQNVSSPAGSAATSSPQSP